MMIDAENCGHVRYFVGLIAAGNRPARNAIGSAGLQLAFASFAPLNTDIFVADADDSNAKPRGARQLPVLVAER
jgi:hypothetical protein